MKFNEQPIVNSLIDTDLYKLTMMQVVVHFFSDTYVENSFYCRNKNIDLTLYVDEIKKEISELKFLEFRLNELNFLRSIPFIKEEFIRFLETFRFDINDIEVGIIDGKLSIKTKGLWWKTILYEIYILSIINEVYFRNLTKNMSKREKSDLFEEGRRRLGLKIDKIKNRKGFKFTEMGTRRRFSREWQMEIVHYLTHEAREHLQGTSNLYLANEHKLKPMGTMAHEYLQAFQALSSNILDSQKDAMKYWIKEYGDNLGVVLTDVITLDDFLVDFDKEYAEAFDGVRQDSGDPFIWAEKIIAHYKKLGIDPKTKKLVFSDSLNFDKAIEIYDRFHEQALVSFGIGTNLTNDLGPEPLDIVMKMTKCNGKDVAKISDTPAKSELFNQQYVKELKDAFLKKRKNLEKVN